VTGSGRQLLTPNPRAQRQQRQQQQQQRRRRHDIRRAFFPYRCTRRHGCRAAAVTALSAATIAGRRLAASVAFTRGITPAHPFRPSAAPHRTHPLPGLRDLNVTEIPIDFIRCVQSSFVLSFTPSVCASLYLSVCTSVVLSARVCLGVHMCVRVRGSFSPSRR
jgi:hypothetical protein